MIIDGGLVLDAGLTFDIASIDFLFTDKDGYDFDGDGLTGGAETAPGAFTRLGATYQQALSAYVRDALGGRITGLDYGNLGDDRIACWRKLRTPRSSVSPRSSGFVDGSRIRGGFPPDCGR